MTTPARQLEILLARQQAREANRVFWSSRLWPGRKGWRRPSAPEAAERLHRRLVFYLVSLSALGVLPEAFGLGASLLCVGGVVLDAWLVYDDGLNREGLRSLQRWARRPANFIETGFGTRPYRLITLGEYNRSVLSTHGYLGRCTIVGTDLGRTLGLHADWWRRAQRKYWDNAWSLGLRGWGVPAPNDPSSWVRATGRPRIYVQGVSAYGVRIAFGKARPSFDGKPRGRWVTLASGWKVPYPGRFVDLVSASQSLSGVDSDDLHEHRAAWGFPPLQAPFAIEANASGASIVTRLARAVHELALVIDSEAAHWGGGLDLRRLWSPGATAAELLLRMGVIPPLAKFHLPDDELSCWTAGLHGGWVEALLCGVPFSAVDIDARSAYPAVAVLLDWWRYVTAHHVQRRNVTKDFQEFLLSPDLAEKMRDKATWRRWGLTRVVLRLEGEPVPAELPRGDGTSRMYVVGARAERYDCPWPDAVLATVKSGHAVEVLAAVQLLPIGRQDGLCSVEIPGVVLDPLRDPAIALVLRRRQAKHDGDTRLVAALRAIVNSLVYGNFARFDPTHDGGERPGPLCFPPLASTVASGCRCLLALVDHELGHIGGVAPYKDTDGLIVAAYQGEDHGQTAA
jgi:hypothetical protein